MWRNESAGVCVGIVMAVATVLTAFSSVLILAQPASGTEMVYGSAIGGVPRIVPATPLKQGLEWVSQFGTLGPAGVNVYDTAGDGQGNVYVGGMVGSGATLPGQMTGGWQDAYVRKYDSAGNELWTRQFGGPGEDLVTAVFADARGVYLAGISWDAPLPGQPFAGYADPFIRLYDPDGNEGWTRQFGTPDQDEAGGVAADPTGVYVAGLTKGTLPGQTSGGYYDAFIRKYDLAGNELWTHQFGGPGTDTGYGMTVDATGVYVNGQTYSSLSGQPNHGGWDAYVRKYSADGTELWTRLVGTPAYEEGRHTRSDGTNVYLAGLTEGAFPGQTNAGDSDCYVTVFRTDGTELWTRQLGTPGGDQCRHAASDGTGVYVGGWVGGVMPGQVGMGDNDALLRKYDLAGNELWTRQFGTAGGDGIFSLAPSGGIVFVAGRTSGAFPGQTGIGPEDTFVQGYKGTGEPLWTRQYGAVGPQDDAGTAVAFHDGIYVTGTTSGSFPGQGNLGWSDIFVRRYNADGQALWTSQFGTVGGEQPNAIAADSFAVYVAGWTDDAFPGCEYLGGQDMFVAKLGPDGAMAWIRQFGTTSYDQALGIASSSSGAYVVGYTLSTFPGQTRVGGTDAIIRKYDPDGNELWTRQFGTTTTDQATAVAADDTGAYVAGWTYGTFPGQVRVGSYDAFVRKYDPAGNVVWTVQYGTVASDQMLAIAADASGLFVAGSTAGAFPGQTSAGGRDAVVTRLDLGGVVSWTRQFGTAGGDYARSIAVDATPGFPGVYVVGDTTGAFPGFASSGGVDAYIFALDPAGNTVGTLQFGTPGFDIGMGVATTFADVYVAGRTQGGIFGSNNPGGNDAFLVKFALHPQEKLQLVAGEVSNLARLGILNRGQANSLIAKLTAARAQLDRGNRNPAANMLHAFTNEVRAYTATGKLPAAEGSLLTAWANNIIDQID